MKEHDSDNALPLVYVIILTWNRKDEVIGAVRSLSRLRYRNYVPLVVDNASEDDTVEALKEHYPDVHVLVNSRNLGYTGGNNEGMKYALEQGADFVILMNNDARVHRNMIERMMEVMDSDPRIAVVGSKNLYENDPNRIWGAWADITYGSMLTRIHGRNQLDEQRFEGVRDVDQVMGCGYMWRKEALEEIGMLDTNFFGYHEDTDWCQRVHNKGWRVVYCGNAITYHKGGVSNDPRYKHSMPVMYFLGRNAVLFARKHTGLINMARLLINSLTGSLSRALKARKKRLPSREKEFLKGIFDGLRGRNSQKNFRVD
ncbi:MAG: glycosyltransferase family 2 protein [bacterium]|nr:glycosyltransferase family 2 protein [bacterium]